MAARRKTKSKRTLNRAECAEELGVHEDTLKAYSREGCPHDKGGPGKPNLYDPDEVAAWMQANGKTGKPGRPASHESKDIEAAKLREINLRCRKHEIAIARDEELLVPVEEVRRFVGEMLIVFRNNSVGESAAVVPQLQGRDPAEQQAILESRAEDRFRNLAKALTDRFGGDPVA